MGDVDARITSAVHGIGWEPKEKPCPCPSCVMLREIFADLRARLEQAEKTSEHLRQYVISLGYGHLLNEPVKTGCDQIAAECVARCIARCENLDHLHVTLAKARELKDQAEARARRLEEWREEVLTATRALGGRAHWDAPHWTLHVPKTEADALFNAVYKDIAPENPPSSTETT